MYIYICTCILHRHFVYTDDAISNKILRILKLWDVHELY